MPSLSHCKLIIILLQYLNPNPNSLSTLSSYNNRELDCFLRAGDNMLKEDTLVDEAIRDVFALF